MKRKKKIQNFFVHCGLAILAFFGYFQLSG